jgi:dipeptidyl aminopeptidase/acylaminoacyl peptidase
VYSELSVRCCQLWQADNETAVKQSFSSCLSRQAEAEVSGELTVRCTLKEIVMAQTASYGSWKSPITADLIVAGSIGLGSVQLDGDDIYWIEMRPAEKGRYVIVRRTPDGAMTDVTPAPFNVRTRVHEYGGGACAISDGEILFSNFADQRLYRQRVGAAPQPLTPESDAGLRYADGVFDRRHNRFIIVHEDHTTGGREPLNTIVSVDLASGAIQPLVSGFDFFMAPRLSPDGKYMAWVAWNHPNMPWDESFLWLADLNEDGSIRSKQIIAGGLGASICQPQWSPDGVLHFVSDRYKWWNLYRYRDNHVEALCEIKAEFSLPAWTFGMSTYAFTANDQIICAYIERGASHLGLLNTTTGKLEKIETDYTSIGSVKANSRFAVFTAASPSESNSVIRLVLAAREFSVLRQSSSLEIDEAFISQPQALEFPTENNLTAHAFYYPPRNPDFIAPENEKPPLLVMSHGGPTAQHFPVFNPGIQYWTSRGIAVLDVNYGGSTGYGREYMERLRGAWGVVDVDDCANGAKFLVAQGKADGARLAITGGSAGGYTTLCALTFRDVFKAGASHYGVSDLIALDEDTHKFEAKYTQSLVAPWPQGRELYLARSPIFHVERLNVPVIFFQGLEDKIVPPNQAEMMVDALRQKGLPVAYVAFEGEQHGFRQAANIKRALEGELWFYSRVFGFEPADEVEPVAIENLK